MKKRFDASYFHRKIATVTDKIEGVTCDDHDNVASWSIQWDGTQTQTDIDAVDAIIATITSKDDIFVPHEVTKYQFKRALLSANQLNNVKAQVPNLTEAAQIYWEDNENIGRESILITELQSLMGLTDTQIDNFFKTANDIDEV